MHTSVPGSGSAICHACLAHDHILALREGYEAYKQTLKFDAVNKVALERADYLKKKCERLGIPA